MLNIQNPIAHSAAERDSLSWGPCGRLYDTEAAALSLLGLQAFGHVSEARMQ